MAAKSANKLPVDDDISMHRKGWIIQRVGWVLMLAFVVASLLGLFGEGPLSKKKIIAGNVHVEYERFCRYEHGMKLKFQSDGEHISQISLPQDYLRNFRVAEIIPEPEKQVASNGYVQYQFEGDQNGRVTFYMSPVERKTVEGRLQVNTHSFPIKQTIYP